MLRRILSYFRSELAIDLGTANTRVAAAGRGVVVDEPSVVAVQQGTGRILSRGCAVGRLARQLEGRTPENIAVVHPLGDGVIADFHLCEAMLRYFLRKAQPPGRRLKPRVLVGAPHAITPVERRALFNSVGRAGASEVWVVAKAKAAAVGAGLPLAEPLASMICDIGGGSAEIAVLSLAETVAAQSIRVGGEQMDRAIADYLRRHYSLRISLPAAERLRIEAGSAWPLEEEMVVETSGLDAASGLPRKATVASEEIRQALGDPLEAILEAVKTTLDHCSPELAADLTDRGMTLCGGGARLRRLDRFFSEQTGLPVRIAPEPQSTLVKGLLICLEHFDQWRPALRSSDEDV